MRIAYILAAAVTAAVGVASAAPAEAQTLNIWTGGKNGAYFKDFCPPLQGELGRSYYNFACHESAGTGENVEKVLANLKEMGMGQGDYIALLAMDRPEITEKLAMIRQDVANECIFMVTKNPRLLSIDDVSQFASRIPFVLPPKASGTVGTFKLLQKNDAEGLGRARDDGDRPNISYAGSVDEMIDKVLSDDRSVGMFVQLPDPANPRFKTVTEKHGMFVTAINRKLLDIKVGEHKVYQPVETSVVGRSVVNEKGGRLTTACTPVIFFTGRPEMLPAGSNERKDQEDLIKVVASMDRTKLLPAADQTASNDAKAKALAAWAWLKEKTTVASAASLEQIEKAVAAARAKMPQQ